MWRRALPGASLIMILGVSALACTTTLTPGPTATNSPTVGVTRDVSPPPVTSPTMAFTPTPRLALPVDAPTQPVSAASTPLPSPIPTVPASGEKIEPILMCSRTQGTSTTIAGEEVPLHESLCVMSTDGGVIVVQVAAGSSWVAVRQVDGELTSGSLSVEDFHLWEHFEPVVKLPLPDWMKAAPTPSPTPASAPTSTPTPLPIPTPDAVFTPTTPLTPTPHPHPAGHRNSSSYDDSCAHTDQCAPARGHAHPVTDAGTVTYIYPYSLSRTHPGSRACSAPTSPSHCHGSSHSYSRSHSHANRDTNSFAHPHSSPRA